MLARLFTVVTINVIVVSLIGCAKDDIVPAREEAARVASGRIFADSHYTLPATVATATEQAEPKPVTAGEQFDAGLANLVKGEPVETFSSLPPEDRDLMSTVVDAIAGFRNTLAEPNALMTTKTAPLVALSEQLDSQLPLTIPTLALCRSVQQFGQYDPIEPLRFEAATSKPVIIYCELAHFRSRAATSARWETKLSYEAVLYRDGEDAEPAISKKPTNILDHCRNRRRDFFLADRMTLPANLEAGKYILKVTVVDQLANHVAEKTLPIVVAAAE